MPTATRKRRERVRVIVPDHLKPEVARLQAKIDSLSPLVDGLVSIDNVRREIQAVRRSLDALNQIIAKKEEHRNSMLQKAHEECEALRKHAGKVDGTKRQAFKDYVEEVTKQLDTRRGSIEREEHQNEQRAQELEDLNGELSEKERVHSENVEALEKKRMTVAHDRVVLQREESEFAGRKETAEKKLRDGERLFGEAENTRLHLEQWNFQLQQTSQQQELAQQNLDALQSKLTNAARGNDEKETQLLSWATQLEGTEQETTRARNEADNILQRGQQALQEAQRIGQDQSQREGRLQAWEVELKDLERRLEAGRRELQTALSQSQSTGGEGP